MSMTRLKNSSSEEGGSWGNHRLGGPKQRRAMLVLISVGVLLTSGFASGALNRNRLFSFVPTALVIDPLVKERDEDFNGTRAVEDATNLRAKDNNQSIIIDHQDSLSSPTASSSSSSSPSPSSSSSPADANAIAVEENEEEEDWWMKRAKIPHIAGISSEQRCHALEDVCLSGRHWFYREPRDKGTQQPRHRVVLDLGQISNKEPMYKRSYPMEIVVDPNSTDVTANIRKQCHESPTRNHLILASAYNEMLGEFYTRAIVEFTKLLKLWFPGDNQDEEDDKDSKVIRFLQQTQLYVHMTERGKTMMESHHLFTRAFRPNGLPLLDFRHLLDDQTAHGCTCLQRLIFCGYSATQEPTANVTNATTTKISVSRGGEVAPGFLAAFKPTLYNETRNFLRKHTLDNHPVLQREIQWYRQSIWERWMAMLPNHLQGNLTSYNNGNWTIVGLTQRTGRRRWKNLSIDLPIAHVLAVQHNILLVEINVEEDHWNPHNQLIRHGALDVMVGIHGAQLTEAIWMNPGSLVVELLPFVPGNLYGAWTRNVHDATPLGVNFLNTDLLHIGYPVTPEETPYCNHNATDFHCWGENWWDKRDFEVGLERIQDILHQFWIEKPTTCADYKAKSSRASTGYVVYNAPCFDEQEVAGNKTATVTTTSPPLPLIPHQYFWTTGYPW